MITALEQSFTKTQLKTVPAPWRRFLVGESPAIRQLSEIIELIAPKRVTVLVSGETGTGKEVVARAIHAASTRSSLPMVAVNCTALPANLVESELFGHAKGAFTGAHVSRVGRFEQAHRSSIFLDEIGDLPLEAQGKLLRVLQEQQFERVGGSETVCVDARVIAASNVDLENAVKDRRFREDLFYRLNVVPIHLVPLRERRDDIPLLVNYFLQKTCAAESVAPKQITEEAIDFLMAQDWPGNIRQLEHTIQRAFALSGDRVTLTARDFTIRGRAAATPVGVPAPERHFVTVGRDGLDFDQVVSDFERSLVNQALAVSQGNKARAADLLRIKRTTLLAKMKVFEAGKPQTAEPIRMKQQSAPSASPVALVVEEEDLVRKLIAGTLEREGYRVLEAGNGAAARDLFACWKSHIKLLVASGDADNSGQELARHLRKQVPELACVVVSHEAEIHAASSHGARTEILLQPFSPNDLLAAVRALFCADAYRPSEMVCA